MAMNGTIEMNKVHVKYKDTEALKDITCKLPFGKIYGLLGRNGAGKTTLLQLLGSFLQPTSGEIKVDGQVVFENEKVMPHITFVYEENFAEETERVKGMLEAVERYRPDFDREYAYELAEKFRLPLNKKIRDLSKGQQAAYRVTIGLANRSRITLFDEAYNGMDAPTRELFFKELLEDHARYPRTILFSTHHVSEVDHLFEEVIILHEGRLLIHAPIDQLLERGASVTGAAQTVDIFTNGMKVLHSETLGGTKQSMVYGQLTDEQLAEAKHLGLEIGHLSLQQLFIHLTGGAANEE